MSTLESITELLANSLIPSKAKESEAHLRTLEKQPAFASNLLNLIKLDVLDPNVKLAASLFFKNFLKRNYIDEDGNYKIPVDETVQIKQNLISIMIGLPKNLQLQIIESISIVAESDFPDRWPTLIDDLVGRLSDNDFITNKAVLAVAHSIFKRWRPLFRSDELFLEIKMVLDKFSKPFLDLLIITDNLIDANLSNKAQLLLYLENLLLLIKIYYDLNCQDIPEFFEDNMKTGMKIIHKYLLFKNDLVDDSDDDNEPNVLIKIKTSTVELIQLYITRYADVFEPLIESFLQTIWNLLINISQKPKYDLLVSQSLNFLSSVSKISNYKAKFNNEVALKEITEEIILPNITLRESDEELFEDDPIEYIRRDLEGSDFETRRKSATNFLRELKEDNESMVTNLVMNYINHYLAEFNSNNSNWVSKDISIYLFSSLAAKNSVSNIGVTSTNLLLDIIGFFTENVAPDLVNDNVHPILKVNAIKYIYLFRNQLTKEQLVETFPLLANHLQSSNYIVYTYTAITIEKILSLRNKESQHSVFNKNDISGFSQPLLNNLFTLIFKSGSTPEKLSENEFLIKCIMRVLVVSEDSIANFTVELLQQFIKILQLIAKNPSNPKFSHYTFESISILIKYNSSGKVLEFIGLILPSLLEILSQDVQEFVPYTFQILAYLLEILPSSNPLPESYTQLIKPLLSPAVWEFRGNIPGITRLLIAILKHSPSTFSSQESLTPLLGVFQKLIASKVNEVYGFDLLEAILMYIPMSVTQSFLKQIAMLLLQRLQSSRTEKYVKKLTVFLLSLCCLENKNSLGGSFVINMIDGVQVGIFGQIFEQFILPATTVIGNLSDRKVVTVGLSQLILTDQFTSGAYQSALIPALESLLKLISTENISDIKSEFIEFDVEDIAFGSNFSKLSSIQNKPFDPVSSVDNKEGGKVVAKESLAKLNQKSNGALITSIVSQLSPDSQGVLRNLGI